MLIDSDVLIDYLRGYEKAINWFHSLDESASISGYSYFELIEGCKNSRDLQKLEKFVSVFEILWLNEREIQNALLIFKKPNLKMEWVLSIVWLDKHRSDTKKLCMLSM